MRVINYRIFKTVHVKTEVTKLTPLPIPNKTDLYHLAIPSIVNDLPDDIMFISEVLLIAPHSTGNYIPKLIKVGASINNMSTSTLSKGVEIKILVLDNFANNSINTITSMQSFKASAAGDVSPMLPGDSIVMSRQMEEEVSLNKSDSTKLLSIIDNKAFDEDFNEEEQVNVKPPVNNNSNNNVAPVVKTLTIDPPQPKRKRGRPKGSKNKVPGQLEMKQLLVTKDEYNNNIQEETIEEEN